MLLAAQCQREPAKRLIHAGELGVVAVLLAVHANARCGLAGLWLAGCAVHSREPGWLGDLLNEMEGDGRGEMPGRVETVRLFSGSRL